MNPLAELCRQMGAPIKQVSGIDPSVLESQDVESFLKIMDSVGVCLRIRTAPALQIWFDAKHLDSLYFDSDFRTSCGLLPEVPRTWGDLRVYVMRLYDEHQSPQKVVKRLMESFIPTPTGSKVWPRTSVLQYRETKENYELKEEPVAVPSWLAPEWRDYVVTKLLDNWCRYDPMAFARYGFQWTESDGLLWARSGVLPLKPRQWIIESLRDVRWIQGHWGVET